MSANETTRSGFLATTKTIVSIIGGLCTIVAVAGILYTFMPSILKTYNTPLSDMLATSDTRNLKATATPRAITADQPAALPAADPVQAAIDKYNAEQEALIAPPAQNIDVLPADAPLPQYVEKQAPERLPAGENVPTSLPIPTAGASSQFGSKPAPPVNPQRDHKCLNGQIWVDRRGCKNPTPVR